MTNGYSSIFCECSDCFYTQPCVGEGKIDNANGVEISIAMGHMIGIASISDDIVRFVQRSIIRMLSLVFNTSRVRYLINTPFFVDKKGILVTNVIARRMTV